MNMIPQETGYDVWKSNNGSGLYREIRDRYGKHGERLKTGIGAGMVGLSIKGVAFGAFNYTAKAALNNEFKSNLHEDKTYEYDKRGNLIGIMSRGKRIKAYEYGASGRLSLSYSNSGNVRSWC